MSLQTSLDVKVKKEAPVEVDSSPPDSPESISEMSDHSREPPVKGKVGREWEVEASHEEGGPLNDVERVLVYVIMCFAELRPNTSNHTKGGSE